MKTVPKDLRISVRIPLKYGKFFRKIKLLKKESWGKIFVASLKCNPTYNYLFDRSDELYERPEKYSGDAQEEIRDMIDVAKKTLELGIPKIK